ncbi:MAG TPA: ribosome-associated translation inhibitor RaiA [Streptosporangiaceae bacterium]|nr:ribosome-associated translation inhibitor RaiA [Streptosporangiaceae bacterium]
MEVIVRGRHITVPARFRQHAAAKLAKLEKLDAKAVRIDVEVSEERNPRQSDRRERVELTIRSRGPAIRAEAAADDRYAALDLAFAKLESRLRRAADRRKVKDTVSVRSPGVLPGARPESPPGRGAPAGADPAMNGHGVRPRPGEAGGAGDRSDPDQAEPESGLVPIQMEGDGPLILREKVHAASPMTIDQALLEMELVGHDFYLFHDRDCDRFSVVYRRRGYDYGVIRLVEE